MEQYDAPSITDLGSLEELTLGELQIGSDDAILGIILEGGDGGGVS